MSWLSQPLVKVRVHLSSPDTRLQIPPNANCASLVPRLPTFISSSSPAQASAEAKVNAFRVVGRAAPRITLSSSVHVGCDCWTCRRLWTPSQTLIPTPGNSKLSLSFSGRQQKGNWGECSNAGSCQRAITGPIRYPGATQYERDAGTEGSQKWCQVSMVCN